MDLFLENKVIVINGGTKGLGKGIALAASKEGAKVVIGGRNEFDGNDIIKEIKNNFNSDAIFIKGDIRKVESCKILIESALQHYGKIDGLVNYSGITTRGTLVETEEDLYNNMFDTNFKSTFFCSKFAVKAMLSAGGGSIVNIGSTHGYGGAIDMTAYACSKGAVLTLTKHISKNYAKNQIRANWITMGWVSTPNEIEYFKSLGHDLEWLNEQGKKIVPMGRLQTVEDNVPTVLFLLSDLSSQITGVELHISGGFFAN
jgi:NAD(P)-dependent dehydrogenase (short-subunit alcohol dehydrogenase family)